MNIIIRMETEEDYYNTEYMTKKAFWNLHRPGCDEHYLVYKLRQNKDYVKEISRVAEYNGEIIGTIMYSKAYVETENGNMDIVTFGPLCVAPTYQNKGVGGMLLTETMKLAQEAGYKAIIIFGEPEYYPRHGFKTCDTFGITTENGENFDAFMGIELEKGIFDKIKGKFHESSVFVNLCSEKVDEFDKNFPYMQKLKLPGQWA